MKKIYMLMVALMTISGCSAGRPALKGRELQASQIITLLNAGEHIYVDSCIIWGSLDFTKLNNRNRIADNLTQVFVNQSVTFNNCIFIDSVKAFDASGVCVEFAHNLSFTTCDFRSPVDFTECIIQGNAFFTGAAFRKDASWQGAHFRHKKVYFNETEFEGDALFQNAVFAGDANFLHSVFAADAMFQKAVAGGLMFFGNTRFNGYADFTYVRAAQSIFKYAEFNGRSDFSYSNLEIEDPEK
ncbi:MAG: pentapeptide repeat-containing protein [Tannerella sp.]|jgi:uncharacterized protein YjbI with pentapeptide repeats|nr:pentapeptide repeat-containing protein [Tannerella sp.]